MSMFYVSVKDDNENSNNQEQVDKVEHDQGRLGPTSNTLKSEGSSQGGGDFDTPPESPDCESKQKSNLSSLFAKDEVSMLDSKPPIPPPRTRKKAAVKNLEKLKLGEIGSPGLSSGHGQVSSDILLHGYIPNIGGGSGDDDHDHIRGHLSMLVTSAKGLRQMMKVRWFVLDKKTCKLKYYRSEDEFELIGELDVQSATFRYDVQADRNGEFTLCSKNGEQVLSAGTPERRLYWLQQLQRARREFSNQPNRNSMGFQVGLLKTPEEDVANNSSSGHGSRNGSASNLSTAAFKDPSPFKEIMQTMDRPPTADFTSPPRSADYYKKPSFFQSLAAKHKANNFKMPRSASMRTPSPPPGVVEPRSPPPSKPVSSPSSNLSALGKLRRSIREKKISSGNGAVMSPWSPKRFDEPREVAVLRDDLQAAKDEAAAGKEVIGVLRKQVETLQKEVDTFLTLDKPDLNDGHLIEILRTKDAQLVEFEAQSVENQRKIDLLEQQVAKVKEELDTYKHLLETKDETIVRLTNQVHEMELSSIMNAATAGTGPDSPATSTRTSTPAAKVTSNGLSFDSDKFEFKEFVDVASQTVVIGDKERESLQDTVTAYEMQNRFLNKEVLELNQLRQQANEREQKLFIEASEWEAKFYQIQSKYLLILNELHNPQVGVSASRQEMVGQLLKDIVEAGERPTLTAKSASYDRFGFRIEGLGEGDSDSVESKAERMRKMAEDQSELATAESEGLYAKWEEAVSSLNGKNHFAITSDVKRLLRKGIPINLRGTVWKAIVDHKLTRATGGNFPPNYYNRLLADYNPTSNLTPAAKQIELDLLRTLPNNRHYDTVNADGIAKLRRVLLAYSMHNPEVEYCQGFNRIVAIALLFMNEEDSFWLLVYIIEQLLPPEYYSRDKQLIGAQVDQAVLKELLGEKLPRLADHFSANQVDPTMFTLNWFLCVFVDNIPVKTYLHIWDSFLFEGSKVMFRYAIAIFKYLEETLLAQKDYMSIFNTLREEVTKLDDVKRLTQIAFKDLNPFPMRTIQHKREHHFKLLEAKKRELEIIRNTYRKNSIARSPVASAAAAAANSLAIMPVKEEGQQDDDGQLPPQLADPPRVMVCNNSSTSSSSNASTCSEDSSSSSSSETEEGDENDEDEDGKITNTKINVNRCLSK